MARFCAVLKDRLARNTSKPILGGVRVLSGWIPQPTEPMPDDERAALVVRARIPGPLSGVLARTTVTATTDPSL